MSGTTTVFLGNPNHSKSYIKFIRDIGESKTKHEEDRIVATETDFLRLKLASPDLTLRERRECLIRTVYCEMLGHGLDWAHIQAIKFTEAHNIVDKRIGYLAVSLLLHEDHRFIMLLVNTLQKDLKSSNPLEVAMALTVICRVVGPEMIPPLLPSVQDKLQHPKELVRKKAIMVMHHFYSRLPSCVEHLEESFLSCLGDHDPGVMEAALNLFHRMIKDDPAKYKKIVPTFLDILRSIVQRKFPKEMDYHGLPSPWMQIKLLQILALLGADDPDVSAQMYPVILDALNSAACTSSIGQSITYETIRTITRLPYNAALVDRAAGSISRFLQAESNDWKYAGINALTLVAQVKPDVAQQYQMTVIDCLDDSDDIIRRKTIDLLSQMTNTSNVTVITERMLTYLRSTHENFVKKDIVAKITKLAEKFSPDNIWFMKTMNAVFELEGNLVRRDVAHNLLRLIAEGSDDDDLDDQLRRDAAQSYFDLLSRPKLSDVLVRQIAWVLGEYSYVLEEDPEAVLEKMCSLLGRKFEVPETRAWVVTAATKMAARLDYVPEFVLNSIATLLASEDEDLQQRCQELCALGQNMAVMKEVIPLDASCEDLEVDASLSFLDSFVATALQQGAAPYVPQHLRDEVPGKKAAQKPTTEGFLFEPYAPPPVVNMSTIPMSPNNQPTSPVAMTTEFVAQPSPQPSPKLESEEYSQPMASGLDVKKPVWGRGGFIKKKATAFAPAAPLDYSEDYDGPSPHSSGLQGGGSDPHPTSAPETGHDPLVGLAPPEVELSEADQKKQALAQALFGGSSGFGKAGALSGPGRATKTKRKFSQPASSSVVTETSLPPSQSPKPPSKPAPTRNEVDLLLDLGDLSMDGSGQQVGGITNGSSSSSGDKGLQVESLFSQPQNPPPSLLAPTQTDFTISSSSSSVPSSLLGQSSSGSSQQNTGLEVLNLLEGNPATGLPNELKACPHTNSEDLCADGLVRVSVAKAFGEDSLAVVLTLSSVRQGPTSLSLLLTLPSNCRCCLDGAAVTGASTSIETTVAAFGTVQKVLSLVPHGPSLQMSIHGELTYREDIVGKKQFLDYQIQTADMLRPHSMKTKEFGQQWGTLSHKMRQKISSTKITTPKQFHDFVRERFRFHAIEIIGKEAIAAALFLPSSPCLVHCKVLQATSTLELSVLSANSLLTSCVERELTAALSE